MLKNPTEFSSGNSMEYFIYPMLVVKEWKKRKRGLPTFNMQIVQNKYFDKNIPSREINQKRAKFSHGQQNITKANKKYK